MGTAVLVILLAVIGIVAGRSYWKKLHVGCCGSGGDAPVHRAEDKDITHYPYHATIAVSGMHCKHCKQSVENAFHSRDGVWAEANLTENFVSVRMKKKYSDWELKQIISGIGYTPGAIQWEDEV